MNKDLMISMLDSARGELSRTVAATPDDKLNWRQLEQVRPILELAGDATNAVQVAAELVESRGQMQLSGEAFARLALTHANRTREQVLEHLGENCERLSAAIRDCSEEELNRPVTFQVEQGTTLPLAGWAMRAYWNIVARYGQINYIQTLYGDLEQH